MRFQFNIEFQDGRSPSTVTEEREYRSDSAARSRAGALAKKNDCPVDLARAGDAPWDERYMTTATPNEFYQSGYSFERLAG